MTDDYQASPATRYSLLRVLILLLAVAAVVSLAHLGATHRRYGWANKPQAPVVSGGSLGQSFYSRYPNLSGIEVLVGTYGRGSSRDKATLLLHLRASPGPGSDLATAVLPPRVGIAENSWYTFTFAPIVDSQDKTFYFEITSPDGTPQNALTLYWWQSDPAAPTDPYARGVAYKDGAPGDGDLAFGLYYSPTALEAFTQVARAASTNIPLGLLLLLLVAGSGLIALVLLGLPAWMRRRFTPTGWRAWLLRFSLPLVLLVALVNGLLYLFLVPPWHGPDEHGHLVYAALLDRHGLDDSAVQRLEWWEGGRDRAEIVAIKESLWASMREHDWTRLLAGYPAPGSSALPTGSDPIYTEFIWQTNQPPAYYWLCATLFRVARAVGLGADPTTNPENALLLMRGVSLMVNLGVVALAWLAARILGTGFWLRLLLPLTVALLPMHAFTTASANNDGLGELAVSGLFVVLAALLRWPWGLRGVGLAGLALSLAAASVFIKGTAVLATAPLVGLGLLVWFVRLGWRALDSILRPSRGMARHAPTGLFAILLLLLVGVGIWLIFEPDSTAAGWQTGAATARPLRVASLDAPDGTYVIELAPGQLAYQWLELPPPHPPMSMTFALLVRSSQTQTVPPRIGMVVDQRGRLPVHGVDTLGSLEYWQDASLNPGGTWTPVKVTVAAGQGDRKVRLHIAAGDQPTQFDAMTFIGRTDQPDAKGGEEINLPVFNASLEQGTWRLRPLAARLLPGEYVQILDVLVNPQAFDKGAIWQRYGMRQFRSFWGNFGWVSIPLPDTLYTVISGVILVSLAGLAALALRLRRGWSWREWLGVASLMSLLVAIIMGFAKQMAPIVTTGEHTDPAGRYLFVLMVPIAWLLLSGLGAAWTSLSRFRLSAFGFRVNEKSEMAMPWGVWLLCATLFMFAAYCLLVLVTPYYYG